MQSSLEACPGQSGQRDLNPRPPASNAGALPTELRPEGGGVYLPQIAPLPAVLRYFPRSVAYIGFTSLPSSEGEI